MNVDNFNNRIYKDEVWFIPSTGKFVDEKHSKKYHKIELENYLELDCSNPKHIVKLRTLIQVYAEHCKTLFGRNVWIKSTLYSAQMKNYLSKFCIIPDVRFQNEVIAIQNEGGKVIKIERPNNEIESNHDSENNILDCDCLIINDTNLQGLFYKAMSIYDSLYKQLK